MSDLCKYDLILDKFQILSKYNALSYCVLVSAVYFHGLSQEAFVFFAADIDYRCNITECEASRNHNFSIGRAVPIENGFPSKCKRYPIKENVTLPLDGTCSSDVFDNTTAEFCSDFVYSDEDSFVKDFQLACQDWKRALIGFAQFTGSSFISPIIGMLSDKYGRKVTLISQFPVLGFVVLIKSFGTNYELMILLEFIGGGIQYGIFCTALVHALELIHLRGRALGATLISISVSLGRISCAGLAWHISGWRNLLRAISGPIILFMPIICLLDESVRWLLSRNNNKKAMKIIKKMARINKVDLPESSFTMLSEIKTHKVQHQKYFIQAMKSRELQKRLFVCSCLYIACTLGYYGLSINSVLLDGNKNTNFILVTLADILSCLLSLPILNKFGRKKTLITFCLLSGVLSIGLSFLPQGMTNINTGCHVLSMMCISLVYNVYFLYAAELFPTNTRQLFMSLCSFLGRMGSMLAPFTTLLVVYNEHLPALVIGCTALLASLLVVTLPETRNLT